MQQQLASGQGSIEPSNSRQLAKMNSVQSVDTTSMQALSEPSEDAASALPSSASLAGRPGSKVGSCRLESQPL